MFAHVCQRQFSGEVVLSFHHAGLKNKKCRTLIGREEKFRQKEPGVKL